MATEFKFRGGRELELALRGLGNEISGRLGQNAVRAGARVIANAAKQYAPIGATGDLKDSIHIFDDVAVRRAGGRERTAWVGSRLFYAYWVEHGTSRMAARSFIRRAMDINNQEAVDKMTDNLGRGIERETAKYR